MVKIDPKDVTKQISNAIEFAAFELSLNASDQAAAFNADSVAAMLHVADIYTERMGTEGKEFALVYATDKTKDRPERLIAAFLAARDEAADHRSAKLLGDLGTDLLGSQHFMVKPFAQTMIDKCPEGSARAAGLQRILDAKTFTAGPKTNP